MGPPDGELTLEIEISGRLGAHVRSINTESESRPRQILERDRRVLTRHIAVQFNVIEVAFSIDLIPRIESKPNGRVTRFEGRTKARDEIGLRIARGSSRKQIAVIHLCGRDRDGRVRITLGRRGVRREHGPRNEDRLTGAAPGTGAQHIKRSVTSSARRQCCRQPLRLSFP